MQNNNDTWWAIAKGAFVWVCVLIGNLNASQVAIYLAILFTGSQLYWGWRKHLKELREEKASGL